MSPKLPSLPKRVFIDTTYTIGSGKSSGIERVVRNLIREFQTFGAGGRIPSPTLVVSHKGKFYEIDDSHIRAFKEYASVQSNALSHAPPAYRRSAEMLCNVSGSSRLRKWLLPQPGHLGLFKVPHTMREIAILNQIAKTAEQVEPLDGDLFILPDAYWVNRLRSSVWPAASQARDAGAFVATIIYDLIPLTHPQFVGIKRTQAFREYLIKAASNSDLLVAISNTVKEQVEEYLSGTSEFSGGCPAEVTSYTLGAELQEACGDVRDSVKELFRQQTPPYLTVATFDPRKNHTFLLDAFDLLWERSSEQSLCLVGRIGSRCDDVVTRIRNHDRLGQHLFLFDDLTDAELHYCYQHARAVIFPSLVEGFGLPIVESLWHGNKTFASDTPIHREVGEQDCSYFSLDCPSKLADALDAWERQLGSGAKPELPQRKPTTWSQSGEQLLCKCLSAFARQDSPSQHRQVA